MNIWPCEVAFSKMEEDIYCINFLLCVTNYSYIAKTVLQVGVEMMS